MKLSLICEHGTRTVELDEGREGIGNIQSISGQKSFAQSFINEVMPRCPLCLNAHQVQHSPRYFTPHGTTSDSLAHQAFGTHGQETA